MFADLSFIRKDAGSFLTDRADVLGQSETRDEYGNPQTDWTVQSLGVPCRIYEQRDRQGLEQFNGVNVQADRYWVALPAATVLPKPCQLRINGEVYSVDRSQTDWTDSVFIKVEVFRL